MEFPQAPSLRRAIFVSVLAAGLPMATAFAADPVLPNFQKVNDSVYRGGQPTDDGIKRLAQLGIKTVVDLRDVGEHSQAAEEKLVKAEGMRYFSVPMKGL